ncbi:MAG: hypothetical protein AB7D57_06600, partial [Desulfovibrionaceae bacterium]
MSALPAPSRSSGPLRPSPWSDPSRRAPKRRGPAPALLLALALGLWAGGCAGLRAAGPEPAWPAQVDAGRLFYAPQRMADADAARRALADLAPEARVPGRTNSRVALREAQGLLRARMQWTQPEYREIENPLAFGDERCDGRFFCESSWPQLERVFVDKDQTAVVDLARVEGLALYADGRVELTHEGGRTLTLAVDDPAARQTLADALYTLAAARGFTLAPGPAPAYAALTPAQAAWLGVPDGVLVLAAPAGTAPARAGLAWPDVVLSIDGRPATPQALEAAAPGAAVRAARWKPVPGRS